VKEFILIFLCAINFIFGWALICRFHVLMANLGVINELLISIVDLLKKLKKEDL